MLPIYLGVGALEPKDFGQVISTGALQCVLKHLHLLQQRQAVVVGRHLQVGGRGGEGRGRGRGMNKELVLQSQSDTTNHTPSIPCLSQSTPLTLYLPLTHPYLQHEPVLDVQHNLLPLPVVSDEGVQRVRVGHPPNQPRVLGQWDHRVAADTAGEGHIAQYHIIVAQHHDIIA